jgi:hypothetical protein
MQESIVTKQALPVPFGQVQALYICSVKLGFITGENICIDGGMIDRDYHNDFGGALKCWK